MGKDPDTVTGFKHQMDALKASGKGEKVPGRKSRFTRFARWVLGKFGLLTEER
ncbi:hypothetical protein KA531_00965 [Candidatus Saccharibacteria bacterium]|nr:hypothetical protein [Candidatus Saccharibacteria bacterium]